VLALKKHLSGRARTGIAALIVCSGLAPGLLGSNRAASAQDQSAAKVEDAILARKTVMDTLSDRMDQIEQMISSNKINLDAAHEDADTISVMLMAFPHLSAGVEPMEGRRRDRSGHRDFRVTGRVEQISGFLQARQRRLQDGL
jgi:hypothetical protein